MSNISHLSSGLYLRVNHDQSKFKQAKIGFYERTKFCLIPAIDYISSLSFSFCKIGILKSAYRITVRINLMSLKQEASIPQPLKNSKLFSLCFLYISFLKAISLHDLKITGKMKKYGIHIYLICPLY